MLSRWARLFVAGATAFVVWLVAAPAYAAAPLCDPRGATAIAPAPQLQDPVTSLDVGAPVDEPCNESPVANRTANPGHAPVPAPPRAAGDSALPTATPEVHDTPLASARAERDTRSGARNGEHTRVDRPPRT